MSLICPYPLGDAESERYGTQIDYYLEARRLRQSNGWNDPTTMRGYLLMMYATLWRFSMSLSFCLKP
jgi:hypothetical protein